MSLLVLLLLAGILRFSGLGTPSFEVFDEYYYVHDACTYVAEGQFFCGTEELSTAHPPLGKWFIAAGIWAFTPTSFGSRVMVALVGTLSVGVLFSIARTISRSLLVAGVAGLLLALDFLHLVMSRAALLDIFLTFFLLLALLFCLRDLEKPGAGQDGFGRSPDRSERMWDRKIDPSRLHGIWRPLAGVAVGLGMATKWTAVPMLPVLVGLTLIGMAKGFLRNGERVPLMAVLRGEATSLAICFGLIPILVYTFTHVGRLEGTFISLPWAEGSWWRALAERQAEMFDYHIELRRYFSGERAPFQSSPAWSWPLIQRPIPFAFAARGGRYREILALGNPLVWWPAIGCSIAMLVRAVRKGKDSFLALVLWAGLAGTYLYWFLFSPDTSNLFLYYFLPAVPFLCLATAGIAKVLASSRWGRVVVAGYLTLVAISFSFFYPVLTWRPLTPDEWRTRVPFSQCDHYEIGDREVVAGYPLPVDLLAGPIPAYPEGRPNEDFVPLLTTRAGWCWR